MKKNILIPLFVILFFIILIGIGLKFPNEEIINWYSGKEIIMTIKPETLTKKGTTVIIKDISEKENMYGEEFYIERKVDNNWKKLQTIHDDYGFPAIGYLVNENNELELFQNWEYMYGELENGHYRLVKYFLPNIERAVTLKDHVYFAVEFDI